MDVADGMFLLETNPVIKYLLLTQKKKKNNFGLMIFLWREKFEEFHTLLPKLLDRPIKFFEYMRMSHDTFYYISHKIQLFLEKQSNFRKCITPVKKLTVKINNVHKIIMLSK